MNKLNRQKNTTYNNSKDDKSSAPVMHVKTSNTSSGSFRMRKNAYYLYALIGICLIFLILKLMFLNPKVVWDESVYLGMGKYIYSSGASGIWEMIRPLGLPLVTGFFWTIGHILGQSGLNQAAIVPNQIILSRIFSILISIGCIIVTYLIAKKLFVKKYALMTALISAMILASTPIFFHYSDYILTDHISTLFLMLAILFLIKDRFILAGIFSGVAFWFKFTHILFILALILFMIYKLITRKSASKYVHNESKYFYTIAFMLIFVTAYFFSNYLIYHAHYNAIDAILKPYIDAASYSNNPYQNMEFNTVQSFLYYIFYYPINILFNKAYGSIIYLFSIIYFIYFLKYKGFISKELIDSRNSKESEKFRESKRSIESKDSKESKVSKSFVKSNLDAHLLLLFIFLTYLVQFSTIPYKMDRFWITFLPFMAIYSGFGIIWLVENKSFGKWYDYGKYFVIIIILILFCIALYKEMHLYNQNKSDTLYYMLNTEGHELIQVETYFDTHNIDSPILVTNPVFAAYSDKRFVGAYDILNKKSLFVNDWESNLDFNAVAYMNSSIPCIISDNYCIENKRQLQDLISEKFIEKDSYIYAGENVTFYVK